jgi:hypothetical protein
MPQQFVTLFFVFCVTLPVETISICSNYATIPLLVQEPSTVTHCSSSGYLRLIKLEATLKNVPLKMVPRTGKNKKRNKTHDAFKYISVDMRTAEI